MPRHQRKPFSLEKRHNRGRNVRLIFHPLPGWDQIEGCKNPLLSALYEDIMDELLNVTKIRVFHYRRGAPVYALVKCCNTRFRHFVELNKKGNRWRYDKEHCLDETDEFSWGGMLNYCVRETVMFHAAQDRIFVLKDGRVQHGASVRGFVNQSDILLYDSEDDFISGYVVKGYGIGETEVEHPSEEIKVKWTREDFRDY